MRARDTIGSLAELLLVRAEEAPERIGFIYLTDGNKAEEALSYGELDRKARILAAHLLEQARPGDRCLLYYPAGSDFLVAFFACAYAGLIGVPAVSPRESAANDRTLRALASVAADATPRLVLTTASVLDRIGGDLAGELGQLVWIASDRLPRGDGLQTIRLPPADALSYLQYTSGSTTTPKGVMISHRNVMANMEAASQTVHPGPADVCVSWLPHFHDMGLSGLLGALYGSYPCVHMSPLAFLGRPLRWLRAITRYRGTLSGAPNFAFDLCCRRVRDSDLNQLDLSSWRVVANGSEPVRKETIERFIRTFEPVGFRPQTMMPSYGLAEAVVFVSGMTGAAPPRYLSLDAGELRRRVVAPLPPEDSRAAWHVACGRAAPPHRLRIVDPDSCRPCPAGAVGEIWFSGPSVAAGYWQRPDESERVFRARIAGENAATYLRTGDLGFIADDQIFIAGRLKDVIIIAGANHYPQDIEATVEACHPAIRPAGVAAFALPGAGDRLVVAAEVSPDLAGGRIEDIMAAIRGAVADAHQLRVSGIGLLQPRSLLKTSSGKIRRQAMREQWLDGTLDCVARWQSDGVAPPEADESAPADESQTSTRAELEARLTEHVRRLLEQPDFNVDVEEPIRRLGLGSIEIAALKAAVEDDLSVAIPLNPMLEGWSVREIAAWLSRADQTMADEADDAAGPRRHAFEAVINPELGRLLRQLRLDARFVHGEGAWLTDAGGRRVLDAIANFGAVPFGHNPPEIWSAIETSRMRGEPALVQPSALEAAGELAERLLAVAPRGMRHVTFTNSGAEATEAALKLVRAATGRRRLLSTHDGFHGKTLGALSVTGRPAYQLPFAAPVGDVDYVPYGDLAAVEQMLAERAEGFAGFIVEPLQGEGGIVEPPPGYLRGAAALCRRHDVKLIVDEIQTGLGRTGRLFACEEDGVAPDVMLLAKALGGGLVPIGAVLYNAGCFSEEFSLKHTSTFAGNTLACRAGLATLALLSRDDGALVRRVATLGADLKAALQSLVTRFPQVLRAVRGRGFMLGLELSDRREDFGDQNLLGILAEQEHLAALLASYLLNVEGVRVAPTLLSNRVIRIEPPLTFTAEQCDQVIAAFERAVGHLAGRDTAAMVNHLLEDPHSRLRPAPTQPAHPPSPWPRKRPRDGHFAFIAHPADIGSYQDYDATLNAFSPAEVAELATHWKGLIDPFVAGVTRIVGRDAAAFGQFIVVPATAHDLVSERPADVLQQIRTAVGQARDAGAKVIGLGGYVSIATGGGVDLGDMGVVLTTGNTYTAIAALEACEHALAALDGTLNEATVGLVGAAGSVGQALTCLMAERAAQLILIGNPAHPEISLRQLRRTVETIVASLSRRRDIVNGGPIAARIAAAARHNGAGAAKIAAELCACGDITLTVDAATMLPLCDVVVTATSNPQSIIRAEHFKPHAVACDLSRPRNIAADVAMRRPDVLVFEGGLVDVPGRVDLGWRFGLPPGTAFACMCEPMILALEDRYAEAAAGIGVSLDYMDKLRRWAPQHGFRLAGLRNFDRPITDLDWRRMAAARGAALPTDAQRGVLSRAEN